MERRVETLPALFHELCPNCRGDISTDRLEKGLPCEKCYPFEDREGVCSYIREGSYVKICQLEDRVKRWYKHFEKIYGFDPWRLQISWARKTFLKRSFALLAPTGVGKTSFGISIATFLAEEGKKSYIILPTKLLVAHTHERVLNTGIDPRWVLVFGEGNSKKKREELKERLIKGDFRILITSSMFLYKNFEIIPKDFEFILVDDVDSFLKTAKNIDKALYLLGFSEGDIDLALENIKLKSKRNKSQEDWERIKELNEKLKNISERKSKGVLLVSSATGNPRSNRIKLFRELLGFEVGRPTFYLRNIVDVYEEVSSSSEERILELVKRLGKGGLIFVSADKGRERVNEITEFLNKRGVKALSYEDMGQEGLDAFERGEYEVLVGISSYRNPIARGIDMPHVVRYALFDGVPKIVIHLNIDANVNHLLWAVMSIRSIIAKRYKDIITRVDRWIQSLRRYSFISEDFIEKNKELKERVDNLKREVTEFMKGKEIRDLIASSEEITLREEKGEYTLVVSDVTGYIQASGRVSRMFAGGITKGLSYILVDDKKAFNNLIRKVRWFGEEINFIKAEDVNLDNLLKEIDEDRLKVKELMAGKKKIKKTDVLKPLLVIVESPNKARTIANFFGKPVVRKIGGHEVMEVVVGDIYLIITASAGHILDLTKDRGFHGVIKTDSVFIPVYETIEEKEQIIEGLRAIAVEADEVYIATDPDTEGEKIGWDVGNILMPYVDSVKRMEFHEVTKRAIINALKNPRSFDENLVKAQVVRRISDRWVGFEVSKILQSTFSKNWLSAGRVQTPVLGWIIEREKEYRKKKYIAVIRSEGFRLDFEFENKKKAKEFIDSVDAVEIKVKEEFEDKINPLPPYTTDTMLRDASERYRFSLEKTMNLAQQLFEMGLITYHRTDSTRVSDTGIGIARDYIKEEFGEEYFYGRHWGEGGAHECIRPTKPLDPEELRSMMLGGQIEGITRDHILLYELIFKRFISSQMRPVKVKKKRLSIKAGGIEREETVTAEIIERGFDLINPVETAPAKEGTIEIREKEIRQVPKAFLYTQGSLVEEMKKRGIGRPSTYATIVTKLFDRGYIIERKGFLIPTKLGKEVYEYLKKREDIIPFVSEEFTRQLEEVMDHIEEGKEDYQEVLKDIYNHIVKMERR